MAMLLLRAAVPYFESFDASLVFGLTICYPHIGPLVFGVRNF